VETVVETQPVAPSPDLIIDAEPVAETPAAEVAPVGELKKRKGKDKDVQI
jgi:hypothetical protein